MSPPRRKPAAAVRPEEDGQRSRPAEVLTGPSLLARHRAILDSTLDPIVTIDAGGTILSASRSVERVFGYTPDEMIGRNISMLMPAPHREAHDSYLEAYRRTGVTNILGRTREFEAVRKDGTLFPIEISVSRVDVPGESMPLFTGIIHDVSQRRRVEEELRLLQELSLAIGEATSLDAAMVEALRRICEATGWEYGEAWVPEPGGEVLVGTPVWYSTDPHFDQFQRAASEARFGKGVGLPGRVWQSGKSEWLDDLRDDDFFKRATAASAAGFRTAVAVPILHEHEVAAVMAFFMRRRQEADQRLLALVAAAVAPLGRVVQHKRLQDALAASEHRFRNLLEHVQIIAVTLDPGGIVTFCNDFFLRLTGWKREEVVGRDWFDACLPPSDREPTREVFRRAIRTGSIEPRYENEILTRSGEARLIAWNNSVVWDSRGALVAVAGLGVDVTEQRRMERELAAHREDLESLIAQRTDELMHSIEKLRQSDRLASIGTLAAGLGHDMNNVLLPMRCRLDAAESMDLPEEARRELMIVRRLCDYLQQLSDGLHLLALDPDDSEASQSTTVLDEWWEQVSVLLQKAVPKHARFEASIPRGLPPVAVAPHRLTQAALNLVVNAGEAIGERGQVRLWAERDPNGISIRLGVADNGRGMTPEVQQRIFDPFFTTKPRGLGTGMGLSLVRGVAQAAGGHVFVESAPGKGTNIGLDLPVVESEEPVSDERRLARLALGNPRLATLIETMLAAGGFEVERGGPDEPGDAAIWVVEPRDEHIDHVKQFLRGQERRQVILCGRAPSAWRHVDAFCIEDVDDFEQVRSVIRETIDAYEGAS